MGPNCETCGSLNPPSNRYCGQCGRRLEQKVTSAPEEFWHQPEYEHDVQEHDSKYEPAADLPPEIIEYDNQVPLIAQEGTDRRLQTPPDILDEAHERLTQEAEEHERVQHDGEGPHSHRNAFLRWDITGNLADSASADEPASVSNERASVSNDTIPLPRRNPLREQLRDPLREEVSNPAREPARSPVREQVRNPLHEEFRTPVREEVRKERTGVSGPSFLGLTDDEVLSYDDEPEPASHYVRNGLLLALAAVLVLAALQWRSIRDYGLAYIENGSMKVARRDKNTPKNPPAVAADNTGRDLGLSPAPAKSGAPQAVESSPNANRTLPVQQAANTPPPVNTTQPAPSEPAANNSPAPDDSKTASQPSAMSSPPPDVPRETASPATPATAKPRSLAKSTPAPSRKPARTASSRPAPSVALPGADELSRAARASDDEARAAWLWRAVGKGNPQAPVQLAQMYERGTGVVRSCEQAQLLLRSAAAKGNEEARIHLQQLRIHGCR